MGEFCNAGDEAVCADLATPNYKHRNDFRFRLTIGPSI